MSLGKDINTGFSCYGKAIGFIFRNNLWWLFIFPVLLNLLLFLGGFAIVDSLTELVKSWTLDAIGIANDSSFFGKLFGGIVTGFIWVTFKVIFFLLFAYTGGYVVVVILSPVLAYLSEKTEKILTGKDYPFDAQQLARDIVRGVLIAARNFFIELLWMIVLFTLSFIPVIGWLTSIVLLIISSYFYGFSFVDYTNERKRFTISQSVSWMRKHKGMAIANGFVFALLLLIPFCGVTLSGFAAIISVVAATLAVFEIVKREDGKSAA